MKTTRIYLIEDDDNHSELFMFNFSKHPEIECIGRANDGELAAAKIDELQSKNSGTHPDLILLDLKIPKKDGFELLKKLKSSLSTITIPVVVMSTSDSPRDKKLAYENGASSFLTKPMDFDEFQVLISDFVRYWARHNQFFNDREKEKEKGK